MFHIVVKSQNCSRLTVVYEPGEMCVPLLNIVFKSRLCITMFSIILIRAGLTVENRILNSIDIIRHVYKYQ